MGGFNGSKVTAALRAADLQKISTAAKGRIPIQPQPIRESYDSQRHSIVAEVTRHLRARDKAGYIPYATDGFIPAGR